MVRQLRATDAVELSALTRARGFIDQRLAPPRHIDSGLVYLEFLRHSSIVVHLEFMFGTRGTLNHDDLADDEQVGSG